MSSYLIEYMKAHLISLEQDSANIQKQMSEIEDMNSDEYWDLEIEDISLNGQMIAISHLIQIGEEHESNNG
ncbi:MAG: hypothetical protein EBW15_08750 [Actinobacteria bacterium]|nr:hypothetical protein [Actinomycetota bacterium]NCW47753.1 hypothetical protein [Actinomycetota bacterium]NCW94740.1 hypothetical protein [Actinomycetota bacterium]